jgi:hypothetical protein
MHARGNGIRNFEVSGFQIPRWRILGEDGPHPFQMRPLGGGLTREIFTTKLLREKKISVLIALISLLTENKSTGKLQQTLCEES